MSWIYKNKVGQEILINDINQFGDNFGFIYLIHNVTKSMFYVGKKNLRIKNNRIIGKKELAAMPDKRLVRKRKSKSGKKKGEWIYYEPRRRDSDWLTYLGSNDLLKKHALQGDEIIKYILTPVKYESIMNYVETKYLFEHRVLERKDYYNENILGKFYRKKELYELNKK